MSVWPSSFSEVNWCCGDGRDGAVLGRVFGTIVGHETHFGPLRLYMG